MAVSIFKNYIDKYFKGLSGEVTQTYNDRKNKPVNLIDTMTTVDYSADGSWNSTKIKSSVIAADIVSTDSSLPLKRRDSFGFATGKIPKLGMKKRKNEDDIDAINTMKSKGATETQIVNAIFSDLTTCADAVQTRLEMMFEEGLSTGMCAVDDSENVGTSVRLNFGYLPENQMKCAKVWGSTGYTPITDMREMQRTATRNGSKINVFMMSYDAFEHVRKSSEGKEIWANYAGFDKVPTLAPNADGMKNALEADLKAQIVVVDNSYRVEAPDGTQVVKTPWETANVIGLPQMKIGRIIYTQLAEETSKVEGVLYSKVGAYTLMSMWRETDPLYELTASQAKAVPVIDGVQDIYVLDTKTAK